MAYKSKSKTPLQTFLRTLSVPTGTSPYVASISSTSSITSGSPLVYTVTLKSTTISPLRLLYGVTGTAAAGTNYNATPTLSNGVVLTGSELVIPAGVLVFTITYTTTDVGYYLTPKTLYVLVDFIKSNINLNSTAEVWTQITQATGLTLPVDGFGMHHHLPYASETNIATAQFGAYRSHDYGSGSTGVFWYNVETSPGSYTWTNLDTLVQAHYARGDTFMLCLYGTPAFHAIPVPSQKWVSGATHTLTASGDYTNVIMPSVPNGVMYQCIVAGTNSVGAEPTAGWPTAVNSSGAGISWAANVVTANTNIAHGFTTGDVVYINDVPAAWVGFFTITVVNSTRFTYSLVGNPGTAPASFTYAKTVLDGTARYAPYWLQPDQYGSKGGACPADPTAVYNYVAAVMARYNAVSSFNPSGYQYIDILEVWNEPWVIGASGNWGDMFLNATASQLVDMVWAARLASKAANGGANSIPVIGCGFTANSHVNADFTIMSTFLNASGTMYPTKKGWQTIVDGYSFHGYGDTSDAFYNILSRGTDWAHIYHINGHRATITAAGGDGANIPMYVSEYGMYSGAQLPAYNALSSANKMTITLNMMLFFFCCGMKGVYQYDFEGNYGNNFGTDTVDNTSGPRGAAAIYASTFAGKTVTSAYYSNGHKLKLTVLGVDYIYDALAAGAPY